MRCFYLLGAIMIWLCAGVAQAAYVPSVPYNFTASLASGGGTATITIAGEFNTASYQLDVPGSATVVVACSADGVTYESCSARSITTDSYGSTLTADGLYIQSVSAMRAIRFTATGGSGTGSVTGRMVAAVSILEGIEQPPPLTTDLVIALGRSTITGFSKFGDNPDVDIAAGETCWQGSATYTHSTAAATWYAMSTSASDTQAFYIDGLGTDYASQTTTVTLSGTTPVPLSGSWLAVNRMYGTSASNQVGTIYLGTSNAATGGVPTDATTIRAVLAIATPASNQTEQAVYTVPEGRTACVTSYQVGARTGNVDASLRVREGDAGAVVFRKRHEALVPAGDSVTTDLDPPTCFAEHSAIEIFAITDANNTRVTCSFDIELVP